MEQLLAIVLAVIALWMGSIEWRLRMISQKLEEKASHKEVKEVIDMKQEVVKEGMADLKIDVHRLEDKIDILVNRNPKN